MFVSVDFTPSPKYAIRNHIVAQQFIQIAAQFGKAERAKCTDKDIARHLSIEKAGRAKGRLNLQLSTSQLRKNERTLVARKEIARY